MSILSGYKRFKDYLKTDSGYILTSRRTTSDAVVMGDGTDDENTVEKNLGAIKGITSDLNCEDESIVASMPAVANEITKLNNAFVELQESYNNLDANLSVINQKSISGTYTTTLTQCAGITLQKGTYIATCSIVSGVKCRTIQLLVGDTLIDRAYASDDGTEGTTGLTSMFNIGEQKDAVIKIIMASSADVTGSFKVMKIK